jgi:tRNA U34 5-methylaminomethyl-2-thiouridine-forming methyltransferase MnmC
MVIMQIPAHLLNEHYDDRYFDVVNALEEAFYIFINGNNIIERLLNTPNNIPFNIGETGFGTGRNLVALMEQCSRNSLTNININYNSVELHPINSSRMDSILSSFKESAGQNIKTLVEIYEQVDISRKGWQRFIIKGTSGTINVNLWIGEALEMVTALEVNCDAWFLDGHGPKKNPLMWRTELLSAIAQKTVPGGTFATYTVAGHVFRALKACGFDVTKYQGFGGKKSVMKGILVNKRNYQSANLDVSL